MSHSMFASETDPQREARRATMEPLDVANEIAQRAMVQAFGMGGITIERDGSYSVRIKHGGKSHWFAVQKLTPREF